MKNFNKLVCDAILGSLALCCCCHCCHASGESHSGISERFMTRRAEYVTTAEIVGSPDRRTPELAYRITVKRLPADMTFGFMEITRLGKEWVTKESDTSRVRGLALHGSLPNKYVNHQIDKFTLTFEIKDNAEHDKALAANAIDRLLQFLGGSTRGVPAVESLASLICNITKAPEGHFFIEQANTDVSEIAATKLPGSHFKYHTDAQRLNRLLDTGSKTQTSGETGDEDESNYYGADVRETYVRLSQAEVTYCPPSGDIDAVDDLIRAAAQGNTGTVEEKKKEEIME